LLWLGSCNHCILACFLWSKKTLTFFFNPWFMLLQSVQTKTLFNWGSDILFSVQSRTEAYSLTISHTIHFYGEALVGGPTLVGCPQQLIQYIRSYPPYWWPLIQLQPEDVPCHADRNPFTTQ
jgi:hypothetical protein